jgi:peptidoglycan/xylan/chitin deacetylase (PgdA/CDA1 family)
MKNLLRKTIYKTLGLFDKIFNRKTQIVILCYHSFADNSWFHRVHHSDFQDQIKFMKSKYQPVTLNQIYQHLSGVEKISRPSFAITFDDGYQSVMNVTEFLKKQGISPTLFVLTNPGDADRNQLGTNEEFLNDSEIQILQNSGWEIGSHSSTHPDFWKLDKNEIDEEIKNDKHFASFSYPRGRYNSEIISKLKKSGYKMAVSMDDEFLKFNDQSLIYKIPRIAINSSHDINEFKNLISPSCVLFRKMTKKILKKYI